MREDAISYMSKARQDLVTYGSKLFVASVSDTQLAQCKHVQQQAIKRIELMHARILRTSRIKKQRLVAYQKEAQKLMENLQQQFAMLQTKPS